MPCKNLPAHLAPFWQKAKSSMAGALLPWPAARRTGKSADTSTESSNQGSAAVMPTGSCTLPPCNSKACMHPTSTSCCCRWRRKKVGMHVSCMSGVMPVAANLPITHPNHMLQKLPSVRHKPLCVSWHDFRGGFSWCCAPASAWGVCSLSGAGSRFKRFQTHPFKAAHGPVHCHANRRSAHAAHRKYQPSRVAALKERIGPANLCVEEHRRQGNALLLIALPRLVMEVSKPKYKQSRHAADGLAPGSDQAIIRMRVELMVSDYGWAFLVHSSPLAEFDQPDSNCRQSFAGFRTGCIRGTLADLKHIIAFNLCVRFLEQHYSVTR